MKQLIWDSLENIVPSAATPSEASSFESTSSLNETAERLMLGLDVAGFICIDATANVTIVPFSRNRGAVLLVVRQYCEGEGVCDIFGLAIWRNSYQIRSHVSFTNEELELATVFEAQIELRICAEYAQLLFAQGINRMDNDDEDEDNCRERESRLHKRVTNLPSGAAQILTRSVHRQSLNSVFSLQCRYRYLRCLSFHIMRVSHPVLQEINLSI